jgi:hypothetical protein
MECLQWSWRHSCCRCLLNRLTLLQHSLSKLSSDNLLATLAWLEQARAHMSHQLSRALTYALLACLSSSPWSHMFCYSCHTCWSFPGTPKMQQRCLRMLLPVALAARQSADMPRGNSPPQVSQRQGTALLLPAAHLLNPSDPSHGHSTRGSIYLTAGC